MSKRHELATRLNPKIQTFSMAPGGLNELDQSSVSAACAGMPRKWELTLRLATMNDWSAANELEYIVWAKAVDFAIEDKWRLPNGPERKDCLRKLAGLAIAAVADPRTFNRTRVRLDWLEVDKSNYCRTWKKRLNALINELEKWNGSAQSWVAGKTR